MRSPSSDSNLPSYAFLLVVVANTGAIAAACHGAPAWRWPVLAVLVALQSVLLIGLQEAKHQCIHRQFLAESRWNDIVGMLVAALFAVNFTGYRSFHLQHHRRTCQADDPEGLLYGFSVRTRLVALLGPVETLFIAVCINRASLRYVARARRLRWHLDNLAVVSTFGVLCAGLWWAPLPLACAWLLPYCLFAWLDFLLTQAEHYGVPIASGAARRAPADIKLDLRLPAWLSWLVLHRTLHRVHHHAPGTRWFEAAARSVDLERDRPGREVDLPTFVRRWLRGGPRMWT